MTVIKATELERATGNLDWLTRCLQEGSISDPQLVLLHQPFPATPVKGLDGLVCMPPLQSSAVIECFSDI